jgi:hypothetical protein
MDLAGRGRTAIAGALIGGAIVIGVIAVNSLLPLLHR